MNIFFVSARIADNVCTKIHLETLKSISDSVFVVDLNADCAKKTNQGLSYVVPKSKKKHLKRSLQFNEIYIDNGIIDEIYYMTLFLQPDIIFVDESIYGRLVKRLSTTGVKIIVFYHDVERILYKEWLSQIGIKFFDRYITGIYNEKLSTKYSNMNLVLNDRDMKLLYKCYGNISCGLLPMAVQNPNFETIISKEDINAADRKLLLFVGKYYYPNLNGLKWFVDNVINKLDESFLLLVIGRGLEKISNEYNDLRIRIIGGVDSLAEYYNVVDVVIAPIFEGGGMKQKTAEAFAYGKRFVGTKEALEGYEKSINGETIIEANTASDFIDALNQIDYERKSFIDNNYTEFCKFYSFDSQKMLMKKIIDKLLNVSKE